MSLRDSRAAEGGALQLTREGIADNDYAALWMADRGFPAPVVIAHSGGGMLGVAHVAEHPETPALVLLSAFRGGAGAQTIPAQIALAGEGYEATMANAQALVAAGRGKELITVPNWWYVISAESYVDRFTTVPDILALAPTIRAMFVSTRPWTTRSLRTAGIDIPFIVHPRSLFVENQDGRQQRDRGQAAEADPESGRIPNRSKTRIVREGE